MKNTTDILALTKTGANFALDGSSKSVTDFLFIIKEATSKGQEVVIRNPGGSSTPGFLSIAIKKCSEKLYPLMYCEALSKRETEILCLICQEYTDQEIAEKLHLSPNTVENHRKHIRVKTGAKNTAGIVAYAFKNKLV